MYSRFPSRVPHPRIMTLRLGSYRMQWLTKNRERIVAVVSFAVITVALVGLFLTRDSTTPSAGTKPRRAPLVDEQPVHTARTVAALASTREEQRFALQALGLADHAVDLAFADAMREATLHPAPRPRLSQTRTSSTS